mgnify:CR=1 FL=1
MSKEVLLNQLKASKVYLDRATNVLTEEDSALCPTDGMMTAAQQIAHAAHTVEWFLEGVFGEGFDLDFEESTKIIFGVTSLTEARGWCTRAYAHALETIEGKSEEELNALTPEDSIMGATPIHVVLSGIVEHTAHHRGALSVYTRLLGKVPAMPYM